MKIRNFAPLALIAASVALFAACSSAEPTATIPAGTPTPLSGSGLFTPHVIQSSATETDGIARSWGRMRRWDARLGWSIELPDRDEWQFVRTVTTDGNERVEARRLDGEDVRFQVVRLELGPGTEALLEDGYDCASTFRTVMNSGNVASSQPMPDVNLGGVPGKMSTFRVINPFDPTGATVTVCTADSEYLYMAAGYAPDAEDDMDDVTRMMRSLRLQPPA